MNMSFSNPTANIPLPRGGTALIDYASAFDKCDCTASPQDFSKHASGYELNPTPNVSGR